MLERQESGRTLRTAITELADVYADIHGGSPSAPGSRERVYYGVEIDLRTALTVHPEPTRDQLAAAAHRHFCVMPGEPTHDPDEIDYDKADEILEILALLPSATSAEGAS